MVDIIVGEIAGKEEMIVEEIGMKIVTTGEIIEENTIAIEEIAIAKTNIQKTKILKRRLLTNF